MLSKFFGSAAASVIVSNKEIEKIIWARPESLTPYDDTDYIFRTLDIGRINHLRASTEHYLVDPKQVFTLGRTNTYHPDITFPGSAGLFVTRYKTLSGKKGLGVLLRDKISDVAKSQPASHVVLAFKGFVENDEDFSLHAIMKAEFDHRGRVTNLVSIPVTPENAAKMLACAALDMNQMLNKRPFTAAKNHEKAWAMGEEALANPSQMMSTVAPRL